MASRPGLNPEDFNGKSLSQAQADYYFNNEPPALRNRVIQGSYVPGSTFKPVVGLSVLSAAQATPQDTVTCTGRYWYPPYIKCIGVHGRVNYYTAMAKSCNVYFQEMGRRAGIAQIGKVGRELGLGEKTGIDLPYESSGLLPHIEWQEQEFGKRREKINNDIDAKIEKLEKEYKEKIAAADAQSKKELERELKEENLLEQQRRNGCRRRPNGMIMIPLIPASGRAITSTRLSSSSITWPPLPMAGSGTSLMWWTKL